MSETNEQKWLAAWKIAQAELERVGREELAALGDEEATRQATYLGVVSLQSAASNSGLEQWQVLMKKLRQRQQSEKA